jgi:hypothetical protein
MDLACTFQALFSIGMDFVDVFGFSEENFACALRNSDYERTPA